MPLLGQASGGWTESSSALRILHVGVRNTVGVLTDDSFTQVNPPHVTTAATVSTQVNTALLGVLSGSVAFSRPDAGGGSNFIGGPLAAPNATVAGAAVPTHRALGVFINTANGNTFENTPGTASGKGPYVSAQGTYGNALYETQNILTGGPGVALVYTVGDALVASLNGYLTNVTAINNSQERSHTCTDSWGANAAGGTTIIGVLKMPADATQGELVYDQRI